MSWWARSSGLRRAGWALVAAGFVVLAVALPLRALAGDDKNFERMVGWANILGFCVAAVGFVLVVTDRRASSTQPSRQVIVETLDKVADAILLQEGQQRARLLGTGRPTTAAANLRFAEEQLVRFQETDSPRVGDLAGVAQYFKTATDGRLVVLGAPGSGKTILAIELLIQLLEQRGVLTDPQERARRPVPVRFSLPAWNTDQPLSTWLTTELVLKFTLPRSVAREIVDGSHILPIFRRPR